MADEYQPTIPVKVRDATYIGGLITAAVVPLGVLVTSVIVPEVATQAGLIGTGVLSAVGVWAAGVGVAYRPGKIGG